MCLFDNDIMHMISLDPTRVHPAPPRLFLSPTRLSSYSNRGTISFSGVSSRTKPDPLRSLSLLNHHQQSHVISSTRKTPINSKNKTHVRTETKLYVQSTLSEAEVVPVPVEASEEKEVNQDLIEEEEEKKKRWGFIKKVYGIVAVELLLGAVAYAAAAMHPQIRASLLANPIFQCSVMVTSIFCCATLIGPRIKHIPDCMHSGVLSLYWCFLTGSCSVKYNGRIALGALILTSIAVFSLTWYTFWAHKKRKDLDHLDLLTVSSFTLMIITFIIQSFYQRGPLSIAIFNGIEAFMFLTWVLHYTREILKDVQYDEYTFAAHLLLIECFSLFCNIFAVLRFLVV